MFTKRDRQPNSNRVNKRMIEQNVALVGFANSGKSTLFNALTGAKQKTGNWTGVTVASKQQEFTFNNKSTLLTDLPGVSSLAQRNQQGKDLSVTQEFIKNQTIDCLINVVDVTQLKRQLYLTTQLLELGIPMVVVLNKSDRKEAENIDLKKLSQLIGCPVVSENSSLLYTLSITQRLSPHLKVVNLFAPLPVDICAFCSSGRNSISLSSTLASSFTVNKEWDFLSVLSDAERPDGAFTPVPR